MSASATWSPGLPYSAAVLGQRPWIPRMISPGRCSLVTCGRWYDAWLGGWRGNVLVFTELVPGAATGLRSR